MDSMVWGFTHLFPSTMRGLFSSDTPETDYKKPEKKQLTDLYAELYDETTNTFNPYAFAESANDDDLYGL